METSYTRTIKNFNQTNEEIPMNRIDKLLQFTINYSKNNHFCFDSRLRRLIKLGFDDDNNTDYVELLDLGNHKNEIIKITISHDCPINMIYDNSLIIFNNILAFVGEDIFDETKHYVWIINLSTKTFNKYLLPHNTVILDIGSLLDNYYLYCVQKIGTGFTLLRFKLFSSSFISEHVLTINENFHIEGFYIHDNTYTLLVENNELNKMVIFPSEDNIPFNTYKWEGFINQDYGLFSDRTDATLILYSFKEKKLTELDGIFGDIIKPIFNADSLLIEYIFTIMGGYIHNGYLSLWFYSNHNSYLYEFKFDLQ